MRRLTASRKEGLLFLAILAVFLITSTKTPERLGVCRYTAAYQADPEAGDFERLAALVGYQIPGGAKITDPARLAALHQGHKASGPLWAVPMPGVTAESIGSDLVFPHVADGQEGSVRIDSTIVLVNTANRDSEVRVEFFKDDGTPLEISVGGKSANKFEYTVLAGNTLRVKTDAIGAIKVGWAKVHISQPVAGVLTFSISLGGVLSAEVGVDNAALGNETAAFAQIEGDANTAFAYVNPDLASATEVQLILSDMDGNQLQTVTRNLGPGGRESKFIYELFPSLAGKNFQGVLLLKSQKPIGVLTLRQKVMHLTSLPSVRRFEPEETASDLCFYRVGAGTLSGLLIQTSFILINNSDVEVAAVLDLFKEDGTALSVDLGSVEGSTLNLTVKPHGAVFLTTRDREAVKLGWARLRPDHPLGAAGAFTILAAGATDTFASEVGVDTTIPLKEAHVFADSIGDRDTAIALSNTNETAEASVYVTLYNKTGGWTAGTPLKIGPKQHMSKFLGEIFPNVANIKEFEGRLMVSGEGIITGTLRQAGTLLTSLPTLIPLHGFKPQAQLELLNQLGGTSPGAVFKIQQYERDMCLETVEVVAPELGFDKTLMNELGQLAILGDTGASESTVGFQGFVESINEDGTVVVGLYRFGIPRVDPAEMMRIAELELSGTPNGNFRAVYRTLGKRAATYVSDDFFLQLYLPVRVVKLPAQGTTVKVTATLNSVSTSRTKELRLVETDRQDILLPTLPSGAPQILEIIPFLGRGQGPIRLVGANLETDLQVLFTGLDGTTLPGQILFREGNGMVVQAPTGIMTGPVRIRQGGTDSNEATYIVAFDPQDAFALDDLSAGATANISASIGQQAGEYQYVNWKTIISKGSVKLAGLAVDQLVGAGSWSKVWYTDKYDLKVRAFDATSVTLQLIKAGYSSPDYLLKLTNQDGGGVLVENIVSNAPTTPVICSQAFKIEWNTTTPLLVLPSAAGTGFTAAVTKTSVRTSPSPNSTYSTYSTWNLTTG